MAKKTVDERVGQEFEGRCMRCKQQRPFTAEEVNQGNRGNAMAKGKCRVCGTTVCRILPKAKT